MTRTLLLSLLMVVASASATAAQQGICDPTTTDSDSDGLSDECELAIAKQFAPVLLVSPSACNWNQSHDSLEGGYLFGAQPLPSGGVRLAYLPAYFQDCGWGGAKCLLRWRGGCDPHAGDSELILIDITTGPQGWQPTRVFLSAHCFGSSDGGCRWFEPDDLQWESGSPLVWVAEGKNANYPSRDACDSGHWYYDTCDRNQVPVLYPIESPRQNIGSAERPFPHVPNSTGCLSSADLRTPSANSSEIECIWTAPAFRGWQGGTVDGSATPYRRYVVEVAEFAPREEPSPLQ